MKKLAGVPASPGIAIGKAFLHTNDLPEIKRRIISKEDLPSELERLEAAYHAAEQELIAIHEKAKTETNKQADIFAAYIMMLQDPVIMDQIKERINSALENAEWVVWDVFQTLVGTMIATGDPMFMERASDLKDVAERVLFKLLDIEAKSLAGLNMDVIVVARDIMPSDVLTMNRNHVKGLAIGQGGRTSHVAILSAALNIPAVLGMSENIREINRDDHLVIDGNEGMVLVNPGNDVLKKYDEINFKYNKEQNEFEKFKDLPAETRDGKAVLLKANIEIPDEAETALRYGASGIGLYRTEFLFLQSSRIPDEDLQFEAYSKVLKTMGDLPVTIRTADIGGDKALPEYTITDEKNPLLGWRAIRFTLARPDIFKAQLRAILRAGIYGNARIMFPLISGIEELDEALGLLDEAKAECQKKGQRYAQDIETGIMIEVPAAAMTANILAQKSSFFSIGTNDLIQYTLAVDRGNEKVNYLANPLHPAIIGFIKMTIDAAHKRGIRTAMCGEMAGDPSLTALLLGLGLDEFSMTSSSIPRVKKIIRESNMEDCKLLAMKILDGKTAAESAALIASWLK